MLFLYSDIKGYTIQKNKKKKTSHTSSEYVSA